MNKSGSVYEGEWRNGKKDGQGKLSREKPRMEYSGGFLEGKYSGMGILKEENLEYRGDFTEGKKVISYLLKLRMAKGCSLM